MLPAMDCCATLGEGTLSDDELAGLEATLRAVADRHRLKILDLLMGQDDAICVCEFVAPLGLAQPTVSHHLKRLADVGLVERERRGSFAYYRMSPGAVERLAGLLPDQPSGVASALTR
jgi:ArsR family transcriptional regulator, arsenate/arsenite/antimonite-responsive transcriptional repressor